MNSRSACPNDARAGVKTGSVPQRDRPADGSFQVGWPGLANSHAAVTAKATAAANSRAALLLTRTTEAADVMDGVPDVGVGELAFEALHVVLRRRAVLNDPENLAVARAARPLVVGQAWRFHVLRRH